MKQQVCFKSISVRTSQAGRHDEPPAWPLSPSALVQEARKTRTELKAVRRSRAPPLRLSAGELASLKVSQHRVSALHGTERVQL